MNAFLVAGGVIIITLILAFLIAFPFVFLSRLVTANAAEIDAAKTRYNPRTTLGHQIQVKADVDAQIKEARQIAAQRAASMSRGANFRIGRSGARSELRTASEGLAADPISAVKIAAHHTWQGAATGPVEAKPVPAARAAGPQKMVKRELVAGKDYAFTPISADMAPEEKRRVRIQNAKAKTAAYKALKESGQAMVAAAAPAARGAAAPAAAAPVALDLPPEPAYIDITDEMPDADKRSARIQNSKLRSAYNKQLKEMGIDPKTMQPVGGAPVAAAAEAVAYAPPPAVDLPPEPAYIDITDDMPDADKRSARIQNSKLRSAFNKQLKEMGIDPKSMQPADGQPAAAAAPAAAVPAAAAAPARELPPPPAYTEITDDMDPADLRAARIQNSKLRSAYNKQLKEMGIDPATVNS